jgi:catechol 2,3-dioxygenase-like lactoylglutathione lyase family enzyme
MLTGIDHVVVLVDDLDSAVADYTALGFAVARGGRHPRGTHNALVGFADGSYLELLAFYEPTSGHRWWATQQRGGGLVDFCMATDDLHADIAAFRKAGVQMSDVFPLSRQRPDGYMVRWVLSVPGDAFNRAVPFLIQDETPRDERLPSQRRHPNGVTGVASLTCVTPDAAGAGRWFGGVVAQAAAPITRDDLDAAGVRLKIGRHIVDYLTPRRPEGPLSEWLRVEGPSLYAATLTVDGAGPAPLDASKLRRTRLTIA